MAQIRVTAPVDPLPERQRPGQRQVVVERQSLVEQRHVAGAPDRSRLGPQQPRQDAKQARLAGAVWPDHLQRLASVQFE